MSGQRFYEEGEAEEILRRAIHETHSGIVDRDQLVSMAAELGISEQALSRAEAQHDLERGSREAARLEELDRKEYRRWRRSHFGGELSSAIMASLFFTALWWFTGRGYFWPGWIIGIATMVTLGSLFGEVLAFSERDYQRWKRKRDHRARGDDKKVVDEDFELS